MSSSRDVRAAVEVLAHKNGAGTSPHAAAPTRNAIGCTWGTPPSLVDVVLDALWEAALGDALSEELAQVDSAADRVASAMRGVLVSPTTPRRWRATWVTT